MSQVGGMSLMLCCCLIFVGHMTAPVGCFSNNNTGKLSETNVTVTNYIYKIPNTGLTISLVNSKFRLNGKMDSSLLLPMQQRCHQCGIFWLEELVSSSQSFPAVLRVTLPPESAYNRSGDPSAQLLTRSKYSRTAGC